MAIAAIELYDALGRLQVLFEMNLVVEFDAAGVDVTWPQGRELRMSFGERVDVSGHSDLRALGLQVPMAAHAGGGSGAKQLCGPFVFDVALRAGGHTCLLFLMDRTIVAGGARLVGDLGSQDIPAQVASAAFLAERSMMGRQGAAAEYRLIAGQRPPGDPPGPRRRKN
jgi:hypothetical protein